MLIKSLYYSKAVEAYDPDYERSDDDAEEHKPPVSRVMARAAWTGLVLQLVSILDDALDAFLQQVYPADQSCRKLADRIKFLAARGHLKWPDRVAAVAALRNKLAHNTNFLANQEDWNKTFNTVIREVEYLGLVIDFERPSKAERVVKKR